MKFFSRRKATRIEDRQTASGSVEIRSESGVSLAEAILCDVTRFGALIRSGSRRALPERINLWFPRQQIDVSASIRRVEGDEIAVQFDHSIACETTADRTRRSGRDDIAEECVGF